MACMFSRAVTNTTEVPSYSVVCTVACHQGDQGSPLETEVISSGLQCLPSGCKVLSLSPSSAQDGCKLVILLHHAQLSSGSEACNNVIAQNSRVCSSCLTTVGREASLALPFLTFPRL